MDSMDDVHMLRIVVESNFYLLIFLLLKDYNSVHCIDSNYKTRVLIDHRNDCSMFEYIFLCNTKIFFNTKFHENPIFLSLEKKQKVFTIETHTHTLTIIGFVFSRSFSLSSIHLA